MLLHHRCRSAGSQCGVFDNPLSCKHGITARTQRLTTPAFGRGSPSFADRFVRTGGWQSLSSSSLHQRLHLAALGVLHGLQSPFSTVLGLNRSLYRDDQRPSPYRNSKWRIPTRRSYRPPATGTSPTPSQAYSFKLGNPMLSPPPSANLCQMEECFGTNIVVGAFKIQSPHDRYSC